MYNILLFGSGPWAKVLANNIIDCDGLALSGICTTRDELPWAEELDIPLIRDWQKACNTRMPDGVVFVCRPSRQIENGKFFLQHRIPVLFEKPLAMSMSGLAPLLVLAKDRNTPFIVDHTYLYNPAYQALKAYILREGLEIHSMKSQRGGWGPFRDYMSLLWDWGPHDVSMALDLINEEVVSYSFDERAKSADKPLEKTINYRIGFTSGKTLQGVIYNDRTDRKRQLHCSFHNGPDILFDDDLAQKLVYADSGIPLPVDLPKDTPLQMLCRHFYHVIATKPGETRDMLIAPKVVEILERLQEC